VLLGSSSGCNGGSQTDGEGFCGWRPRWRKRERGERFGWQQKGRGEASFLLILDPKISSSGP